MTHHPANPLRGILLMLGACVLLPVMDGVAKLLSQSLPVLQIVWARYFFHLLLLSPVVLWIYGRRTLRPQRPGLQALRSLFMLGSTSLFFLGITYMPIADTLALAFINPLVVTALSPWVLKEKVGLRRWMAVIVGFLGALIVLRPGFGEWHWASLAGLGAGVVHAGYILATRKLSGSTPPLVGLTYAAVVGGVVTSAGMPFVWVPPTPTQWAMMASVGLLAATCHFMVIRSLDHGEASLIAPFGYAEIVMATIVGLMWFGEFPDAVTWVGIAVIAGSGIYISIRERRTAAHKVE
ncbi:hypothetical protein AUP43_11745 [Oceanibaculum pacificum]|uniref:EamA domain-containing protein n=2 Tax=Oceanibaculum pacificum TaxID=580166 RepID=A0A154VVR5_9PROT|nr:hypothetical protein AUP43_11745 [Oceanibaculum pacificum]